jgi:hypothetical protein
VSAQEIIEQIKVLPASERAEVVWSTTTIRGFLNPFKQGMADVEAGRLVELDTALNEPYADT